MFHLTKEGIHSNSISTFSLLSRLLGSQRECRYVWFWGEALHFPCPSPSFPCAVTSWLCDALLFVPMSLDAAWVSPVIPSYCTNKSCTCGVWHCWNLHSSFPMTKRWNGTAAPLYSNGREVAPGCLLDNALVHGVGGAAAPGCAGCRLLISQVCWTPARVPCTTEYLICCWDCWATQHSRACTWEHSPGLHQQRTTALCDSRFLRCEDSFDTSLCDWIQGCMVLSLPGGMSLGRESVLQALTQTRSLSRVSWRNQIVKPVLTISPLDAWQKNQSEIEREEVYLA